jgi:DNA-binding NtrC family response regulator
MNQIRPPKDVDLRILIGSRSGSEENFPISNTLSIPPLRRRREDIEPLARHFVKHACEMIGKEQRDMAPDVLAALKNYDWPGNVAELRSVVSDMVEKSGPPALTPSLIPSHITESAGMATRTLPVSGISLSEELERIEKALILEALKASHGIQYKAAQLLGLKPTTLNMKLSRFGIDPKMMG